MEIGSIHVGFVRFNQVTQYPHLLKCTVGPVLSTYSLMHMSTYLLINAHTRLHIMQLLRNIACSHSQLGLFMDNTEMKTLSEDESALINTVFTIQCKGRGLYLPGVHQYLSKGCFYFINDLRM